MPAEYNPKHQYSNTDYYVIGQLLRVLIERCDRERVQDLCEQALSRRPYGLELRNEYILPIRENLAEWTDGITLHVIIKMILSRILDDTVEGGKYDYEKLTLDTIIAFDPNSIMKDAIV